MNKRLDRCRGVVLGLALGDSEGAAFEGGVLERLVWRLIGRTRHGQRRWTDDTQMSLDIAESLIAHRALVLDDIAIRFASSYRWSRGYGPGAAKILAAIRKGIHWREANRRVYPQGSLGNGGAMRAPIFALLPLSFKERVVAAARCAEITHAHPQGIEGAEIICAATSLFLENCSPTKLFATLTQRAKADSFKEGLHQATRLLEESPSAKRVAKLLGAEMTATRSCITALFCAAHFIEKPIEELIDFGNRLGGDTDTILAMACAMWGAARGAEAIPEHSTQNLEQYPRLNEAALQLADLQLRFPQPQLPNPQS